MTFKAIVLFFVFSAFSIHSLKSQVTIGSGEIPVLGSLLDIKEKLGSTGEETATKGLGLPRVSLSKKGYLFPMFGSLGSETDDYDTDKTNIDNIHIGMVVYNLTTDLDEGLCPGVYVWEGKTWNRLPKPCPAALTLEDSPNSYIVAPNGGSVEIPCGKPYLVSQKRGDVTSVNLTDKVSLELLWQDKQNLIDNVELVTENSGPYSRFKVTTKSGTGNALVAVRMGETGTSSDPIVWSWHIWVTDYTPDNPSGTDLVYAHNNGEADYTFMDRNLGATSASKTDVSVIGLTYQWGRKDPFPSTGQFSPQVDFRSLYALDNTVLTELNENTAGSSGTGIKHELASNGLSGATNNLLRSVQNPLTFLYGVYDNTSKALDWYTISDDTSSAGDDSLWNATKSDFDPCPEGWKVPAYSSTKSPWANFEGVEDFGGINSDYVVNDASENGVNLIANGAVFTALGFYPYSNFRRPREYYIGGAVGSSSSYGVGGSFQNSNIINVNSRESSVWIAKGNASTANAKALNLYMDYSGMMTAPSSSVVDAPRAMGAYVRCVKDN